jgi:hypothetical protein
MRRWALWAGLILLVLMGRVWEHVQAVRLERQMKLMHAEADLLTYENGCLRTQIHQYVSPSHLEDLARRAYQLEPIDPRKCVGLHP